MPDELGHKTPSFLRNVPQFLRPACTSNPSQNTYLHNICEFISSPIILQLVIPNGSRNFGNGDVHHIHIRKEDQLYIGGNYNARSSCIKLFLKFERWVHNLPNLIPGSRFDQVSKPKILVDTNDKDRY